MYCFSLTENSIFSLMFYMSTMCLYFFALRKLVTHIGFLLAFFTIYNLNDWVSECCNKVTEVIWQQKSDVWAFANVKLLLLGFSFTLEMSEALQWLPKKGKYKLKLLMLILFFIQVWLTSDGLHYKLLFFVFLLF